MSISALTNQTLLLKFIAAFTTYGFTIVLARTMLPGDFGKIAIFLNIALVLSVVGARGQQMAAIKFVPSLILENNAALLSEFIVRAFRTASISTGLIFFGALIAALSLKAFDGIANYQTSQIFLGMMLIPLVGLIDFQSHIARGMQLFSLSLVPKEICWRAITAAIVLLLYLANESVPIGATKVLYSLIAGLIVVLSIQAIMLRQWLPPLQVPLSKYPKNAECNKATGPFWVTSVSNIFLANVDVILVGMFTGPTLAGLYFAANRLAMLLSFFSTSQNVVLGPVLSEAHLAGRHKEIQTVIHKSTRQIMLPTVGLAFIMFALAPQFLELFGSDFISANLPLRILVVAAVINAAFGPADIALNMCGFHKNAMIASAWSLALSAMLLVFGTGIGGASGAAVAVLTAIFVRKMMFWRLCLLHLSIRTDILAALNMESDQVAVSER